VRPVPSRAKSHIRTPLWQCSSPLSTPHGPKWLSPSPKPVGSASAAEAAMGRVRRTDRPGGGAGAGKVR
jgi:hypothetical protein